jgi:hypothetical protein
MNHYQKIAMVVIRSFGALLTLYGIVNLVILLLLSLDWSFRNGAPMLPQAAQERVYLNVGLYYGVIGAIIFFVGKPIGKLVAKGLDD